MSKPPTELTLIICTRDRAEQLHATLDHLNRIVTERPWELVIVDNGSTDSTPEVVRRFRADTSIPVAKVDEPRGGLSRARNAGCRAANSDVIAFTDDDCYPHPDFVDALLDIFDVRTNLGFIGGRVILHDSSDAPVTIREQTEPESLDPHRFPRPGFIHGANMAVRRELLRAAGGFDECLGAGTSLGSGEDIDLCARAANSGWTCGYFPTPTVHHHHGRKPGPDLDRVRKRYDRGRGGYYGKTLFACPTLRHECLKHWYWQARAGPWSRTRREVAGALRYLLCHILSGRS